LARREAGIVNTCILLDTSSSMSDLIGARSKIENLADIVRDVAPQLPGARWFCFASSVREIEPSGPLPPSSGSTALHLALEHIAPLNPERVVIVSDGLPDDRELTLAAARHLHTNIVCYFCGDERDFGAIAFLRALSWASSDGIGHAAVGDLRDPPRLAQEIVLRLTGPAR
jgi:hypothetical protein